ncbi:hypothetical protein AB0280_10685 [Pseudarthrobacter sp902506025]|uniref:Uncharacterized protein n=1 Tax=Pseudarthrobacter defluvii TaxID=410837 RepID=A0ABT9UJ31_9MICC|nr:hypothetical protein [Pseudarthrobacter defluvii]MDQ0119626.1 hypothetical protein [Pseudarthrobacter defluvii]
MTQENQQAEPESAPGGYGTPTAEQEAAGTQGGQQSSGGQQSGGASSAGADTNEPQSGTGGNPVPHDMDLPSSAAEIDESNDDSKGSAPVSSESGQEATGIPDGSGNDLPQEKSPNDDDESFDAG